jgi:hypothetical protein
MHRFLAYWLLAFVLTLPSWWIVAAQEMADRRDLLWTAGFAAFLAAVLCLSRPAPAATPVVSADTQLN